MPEEAVQLTPEAIRELDKVGIQEGGQVGRFTLSPTGALVQPPKSVDPNEQPREVIAETSDEARERTRDNIRATRKETERRAEAQEREEPQESIAGGFSFDEAIELFGTDFTGLQRQSDGTFIADKTALERIGVTGVGEQDKLDKDFEQLEADFARVSQNATDAMRAQIDAVRGLYDARRTAMKDINNRLVESQRVAGLRMGARFAPQIAAGILSEEESQGIARLRELDAEEAQLVAAMEQAIATQEFETLNQKREALEKRREERQAQIEKLEQQAIARNKQIEEDNRVGRLVVAVAENPEIIDNLPEEMQTQVIDRMIEGGLSITSLFVDRGAILRIAEKAAQNGADRQTLDKISSAKSPEEAIQLSGGFIKDPMLELDRELKSVQIERERAATQKLRQDIAMSTPTDQSEQVQKAASVLSLIKDVSTHPALKSAVGPADRFLPKRFTGSIIDFRSRVDQLKDTLTLDNLGLMSGVLSETDIRILANAATRLDTKLPDKAFVEELTKLETKMISKIEEAGGIPEELISVYFPEIEQEDLGEIQALTQ